MSSSNLSFRISAALKDIIGRDLITDDNVAVFELVKNSFDAYATKVDVRFENLYEGEPKIIIEDNGKGMDREDIENKWLFVAYSAKRDGTEDDSYDYRDDIFQNRPFAGAKGIGRFSCDRLGTHLRLETTKNKKNSSTEVLITDWENFEGDLKDEFVNIAVSHESIPPEGRSGTKLEITGLRSEWNRAKLLKLKDSLAKLINPNRGKEEHEFSIFIHAPEELENDSNVESQSSVVNGRVENFIFEALELKTTQIITEIDESGEYVVSQLFDGGTLIYKIKERNESSLLNNISVTLFYLNQSAKLTFARRMGLSTTKYGNIFLYKNGFRIYPYGEPGEDPFRLNARYAQGYSRYLGLRNLMGRVEVFGQNAELKETTSRADGLIKTPTYDALVELVIEKALKRLEKYVIDVQNWGLSIEEDLDEQDEQYLKNSITDLIAKLTNATQIVDVTYGDDFLDILQASQSESAMAVLSNLKRIAKDSGNDSLLSEAQAVESKLSRLKLAKEEVEKEKDKVSRELEVRQSENLFLKSIKSQDFEEVVSFLHHIGISAKNIDNNLKLLLKKVQKGIELTNEEVMDVLRGVMFENRKILSISKFASKANFKLYTSSTELDVISYVTEYIKNILGLVDSQSPVVRVKNDLDLVFIKVVKPIELNIIIDNLISNARRAKAKNVIIDFEGNNTELRMSFADDGRGIDPVHSERIFELGYTTTSGSGIGLYHVRKMLNDQNSSIFLNLNNEEMTEFIITFNK